MEGELKGLPKPFKFEKMWPGMRTSTLVLWLKILGVHTLEALPFLWWERRSKKQRSWTSGIENGLAMYNRGLEKWEQLWKDIQTQQPSEYNVDCFRVYIARLLDCFFSSEFYMLWHCKLYHTDFFGLMWLDLNVCQIGLSKTWNSQKHRGDCEVYYF